MGIDFHNPLKGLSKPELYAVIGGTVLIGGYAEYRHHASTGSWNPFAKTSSAAGSGTQIDPVTGMAYSQDNQTDPVTGLSYLAEAQQYGSVQAAESAVSAYGQSPSTGSGIWVQPAVGGQDGSSTPVGASGPGNYANDAAWVQAATAGLGQIGYDTIAVSEALGKFINSVPLTADEAKLVNTARAEYGNPPGNEQVILAPTTQPGPTGTTTNTPSISNGHVISSGENDATVGWTGTNAVRYGTEITGPGKINGQRSTVNGTQATFSGLEGSHSYTVTVTPYNASGKAGQSGHIEIKTAPVTAKKG